MTSKQNKSTVQVLFVLADTTIQFETLASV
jgi:hypothetical protein